MQTHLLTKTTNSLHKLVAYITELHKATYITEKVETIENNLVAQKYTLTIL